MQPQINRQRLSFLCGIPRIDTMIYYLEQLANNNWLLEKYEIHSIFTEFVFYFIRIFLSNT